MGDTSDDTFEAFMGVCDQFKLGELVTESPNPISANLSYDCDESMAKGLSTLQAVDRAALQAMLKLPCLNDGTLEQLARDVHDTITAGRKVFMVGCGATGRLSMSLEVFAREGMVEPEYRDSFRGFMAGGDVALIRSIEKFEDREEYGRQQLRDLDFVDGDLILAITEGGETPFVIAAGEEGVKLSPSRKHYFLYCNPDETLCRLAERSKRVIENDRFIKMNLTHGPMGITGSTRMQATTVQLLVAGLAIQHHAKPEVIKSRLERITAYICDECNFGDLAPFTSAEAALYRNDDRFIYSTDFFTLTVMTDTTERSPTFSFPPFENFDFTPHPPASPVYMHLPGCASSDEAWERLLHRPPRGIDWPETRAQTSAAVLKGYDFSDRCIAERRARYGEAKTQYTLSVNKTDGAVSFEIANSNVRVDLATPPEILNDILLVNIAVKAVLNAHSTCIMARNGRVRGNVMLYVKPTNNKLIDRATRYVQLIIGNENKKRAAAGEAEVPIPDYKSIVRTIYETRPEMGPTDPVVVEVIRRIEERARSDAAATKPTCD